MLIPISVIQAVSLFGFAVPLLFGWVDDPALGRGMALDLLLVPGIDGEQVIAFYGDCPPRLHNCLYFH